LLNQSTFVTENCIQFVTGWECGQLYCRVETGRGWRQLYWEQGGDGQDGINGDEDGMGQNFQNLWDGNNNHTDG